MINFSNIPPVVKNLLIINGIFFLATTMLAAQGLDLTKYLGLHYWGSDEFMPHQLITYMFMHGSFMHLLFNMFAVWMFGRVLEQVWGQKKFLIFFMVTGIGAGLLHMTVSHFRLMPLTSLITPEMYDFAVSNGYELLFAGGEGPASWINNSDFIDALFLINIPAVGASGSAYGILVAFGMLFPNTQLMLLFPPIPIKAKYLVAILIVVAILMGFGNFSGDNVAHFAHLGGALAGFIMVKIWQKNRNKFY